jgi:hypothetical protein
MRYFRSHGWVHTVSKKNRLIIGGGVEKMIVELNKGFSTFLFRMGMKSLPFRMLKKNNFGEILFPKK